VDYDDDDDFELVRGEKEERWLIKLQVWQKKESDGININNSTFTFLGQLIVLLSVTMNGRGGICVSEGFLFCVFCLITVNC
jgi:hypothetical protein